MTSFFKRLFKPRLQRAPEPQESFVARYYRFKQFLSASMDGYSTMLSFEERLANDRPFGMPFLRASVARLAIATMQCIIQLQALGGPRFTRVDEPFAAVRQNIKNALESGTWPLDGPTVVRYGEISDAHQHLIAPSLHKISALKSQLPKFMPKGFVITGAAWWDMVNYPELLDEIDRRILVSQDDPNSYHESSIAIREYILKSMPLPTQLQLEIEAAFADLKEDLAKPGMALLIRCMPVRQAHGVLVLPEQIVSTPIADIKPLLQTVVNSFSLMYRPRAMIYRLKLGLRDRGMPFCIACSVFPMEQARGSTYRSLDPKAAHSLQVHMRRNSTGPNESTTLDITSLPTGMLASIEENSCKALSCFSDAPVDGVRHEIYWAATPQGDFSVLGVMALPDPAHDIVDTQLPALAKHMDDAPVLGGECIYPGLATGTPYVVRNFSDALYFPIGGMLVLEQAKQRWAFMLDFASGAIAEEGNKASPFSQVARRYGRPTVLNMPGVVEAAAKKAQFLLLANMRSLPAVCPCPSMVKPKNRQQNAGEHAQGAAIEKRIGVCECANQPVGFPAIKEIVPLPQAEYVDYLVQLCGKAQLYSQQINKGNNLELGHLWLLSGAIGDMARELSPLLVQLTLPDSDSQDFRAENCVTIHDFLAYCNHHAVTEMYRVGAAGKSAQAPAKQLVVDDVPKQFYIMNLSDGYTEEVKGPVVHLEKIASRPMLQFWEGFSAKIWEGPPQVNMKGLMATIFEATRNPNLDPASGPSHYAEKNIFLIAKDFCSMRCRFGFHYLMLDCFFSERPRERFLVFQFKGGAANLSRRIRRVHFIAELLAQVDCSAEIVGDALIARMEGGEEDAMDKMLKVIGYLFMHTRQLDMIMADEHALAIKRTEMLADMLALVEDKPLCASENT